MATCSICGGENPYPYPHAKDTCIENLRAEIERMRGDEELFGRAHQWKQLCDMLGLAHATHPRYIADQVVRLHTALDEIAKLPYVTEESSWTWKDISTKQTDIARAVLGVSALRG